MSWNEGYVTDVGYTHGYYRELSPTFLDFALLLAGRARRQRAGLAYLELGCGQGFSTNVHAAAHDGLFYGTDFAPAQTLHAAETAEVGGTGAVFLNDSFADLLRRDDLPEFDIIGLHGVWSWISAENRSHIVSLIGRRLAPGGVVYISYNTQPGASFMEPLRHIMALHAQSSAGPLSQRITAALDFAQRAAETGGRYFAAHPGLKDRIQEMRGKDWRYLAHEYFNKDWAPMPFSEVSSQLSSARLEFATSAFLLDSLTGVNINPAGQTLLAAQGDPILRETLRDYLVNQNFRRDIFTKGARILPAAERNRRLAAQRFVFMTPPDEIKYEVTTPLGKLGLRAEIYGPVIQALKRDDGTLASIGELARDPRLSQLTTEQILEALTLMVGVGALAPAKVPTEGELSRCASLNAAIHEDRRFAEGAFLASPVIGCGAPVAPVFRIFRRAERGGARSDAEMVASALAILQEADLRPAPENPEAAAKTRANLATDIVTYRKLAPIHASLGVA